MKIAVDGEYRFFTPNILYIYIPFMLGCESSFELVKLKWHYTFGIQYPAVKISATMNVNHGFFIVDLLTDKLFERLYQYPNMIRKRIYDNRNNMKQYIKRSFIRNIISIIDRIQNVNHTYINEKIQYKKAHKIVKYLNYLKDNTIDDEYRFLCEKALNYIVAQMV